MKTIILVGGGHAHLHCLAKLNEEYPENWRVVLISSSIHQYYSGMFSGFTEGVYTLNDIRIDLQQLCKSVDVEFIVDNIDRLDAEAKTVSGSSGTNYEYDRLSFDIGSQTAIPETFKAQISSIKPNHMFPEQLMRIRDSDCPVIVGGGASGVELAFSIHAWRKQQHLPLNLVLLSSSPLLSGQSTQITRSIGAIANRKALPFFTGKTIEYINDHKVMTDSGQSFPHSDILWLTGPKSSEAFRLSNLPTDEAGYLLVNESLQSVGFSEIFGAGDCVTIDRYRSLPKNGVYAVKQGPLLWQNLNSSLESGSLKPFVPQKKFVSILSTGSGKAFLTYGRHSMHGKIPWKIKQSIDKKFMNQYKKLYE